MEHTLNERTGEFTYDILSPQRIVFGWGRRREIGALARSLGDRAFVVSGSKTLERSGQLAQLFDFLRAAGIVPLHAASVSHEPEVADVDHLTAELAKNNVRDGDLLIGIGGGSAMDLAKAAAAMAANRESDTVRDYLEGVGRGLKIDRSPLPMIAVPTTAGTGSEATKNAVISSYEPPYKKSVRSDAMVPRIVLVDPELTAGVPPDVTAHTGMDTITQLIESYISRRAKPVPQALTIHGLPMAVAALPEAFKDGQCRWAREAMAHAALLSGMALANSGLGVAHGVAAALGSICRVRHGLACAVMLPTALRMNQSIACQSLATLGGAIGCKAATDDETAERFIEHIEQLVAKLGIPSRLRELSVSLDQIPALVAASQGNSLTGNPREISDDELRGALERIW
jgi:alcohol dehydrogenase class IV